MLNYCHLPLVKAFGESAWIQHSSTTSSKSDVYALVFGRASFRRSFTNASVSLPKKFRPLLLHHHHQFLQQRIITEWGKVTVTWWTHAIQGLHRNDFIMAAKTDAITTEFAN
ncbi:hypothetical protein BLD44_029540 [Mastigocladus laminosus UU774]|nr:hypothetical protein BLD44_029540 [Mastigocladus laminosus UU774]